MVQVHGSFSIDAYDIPEGVPTDPLPYLGILWSHGHVEALI